MSDLPVVFSKYTAFQADGACYYLYLVKWCQIKLFGDELLEVEDCGLCWTADPLAFQTPKLAAVALQADADLSEETQTE